MRPCLGSVKGKAARDGSEPRSHYGDTHAAPRHTVGILTESLNYLGAEVVSTILAPGVHRRGEVRERTDLMEAARRVGQAVVQGRTSAEMYMESFTSLT